MKFCRFERDLPVRNMLKSSVPFAGRPRSADLLLSAPVLAFNNRNCQQASPPGLQPHRFVPGAPTPSIIHFTLADGFQGLLGATEPRKMRTVVQKIGRLMLRMLCHALAGGFRALHF